MGLYKYLIIYSNPIYKNWVYIFFYLIFRYKIATIVLYLFNIIDKPIQMTKKYFLLSTNNRLF